MLAQSRGARETASGPPLDDQATDSRHSAAATGQAAARSTSLLKIGLEVLLISTGVFLGLMGEQWREHAQQRQLADASLRRLRTEAADELRIGTEVAPVNAAVTAKVVIADRALDPVVDPEQFGTGLVVLGRI